MNDMLESLTCNNGAEDLALMTPYQRTEWIRHLITVLVAYRMGFETRPEPKVHAEVCHDLTRSFYQYRHDH